MLNEVIDTDANLVLISGLILGLLFGVAAQVSKFCLRRAVASDTGADRSALAVWIIALATATAATQGATALGFIDLGDHRFLSNSIPWLAIMIGGLAFGAGMVLTRGCASRLSILAASGNLRAVTVLVVFAIVAHATIKGVFAPLRTSLTAITWDVPLGSLAEITGAPLLVPAGLGTLAIWLGWRSRARLTSMTLGALIGLIAAMSWAASSVVLQDPFEPAPVQAIAFTAPWADSLFWTIASTAITPGFGVGFIGGVLAGAFLSAALRREVGLESFSTAQQTLRYSAGGAMMGFGGALAGGCTIGAGLAGGATLSVSAMLALAAIITGAIVMRAFQQTQPRLGQPASA